MGNFIRVREKTTVQVRNVNWEEEHGGEGGKPCLDAGVMFSKWSLAHGHMVEVTCGRGRGQCRGGVRKLKVPEEMCLGVSHI